jgi:hypothetical protein
MRMKKQTAMNQQAATRKTQQRNQGKVQMMTIGLTQL